MWIQFGYLWTIQRKKARLLETRNANGELIGYVIVDAKGQMVRIEDDETYKAVIERRKKAGVRIVSVEDSTDINGKGLVGHGL